MSASRSAEWGRTLAAAGIAAAAVLAFRAVAVRDPAQPNAEFLPDMARSAAWMSQMDGAPTPDGLSDRPLPAGVVPRGPLPFRYGATPEEAARAGRELVNPFSQGDAAAVERGAAVFARDCVPCHGADGEGRGGAVLRGMLPPPSLLAERARTMPDGQMFHVVTKGQGNMASYAVQVVPDDRWKAILHVRRLQRGGVR